MRWGESEAIEDDLLSAVSRGPAEEVSLPFGPVALPLEQDPRLPAGIYERRYLGPAVARRDVPAALERRAREAGGQVPQERLVERDGWLVTYCLTESRLGQPDAGRLCRDVEDVGHPCPRFVPRSVFSGGVQRR